MNFNMDKKEITDYFRGNKKSHPQKLNSGMGVRGVGYEF